MKDAPGIDLERYAFVTAGLADGIELEELLAQLEIDEPSWQQAEAAWQEQLLGDLRDGMRLTLELDELQREARRTWERAIPPLDDDLRAWLDFQRGLGAQQDPAAYLASIPLCASDIGVLAGKWAARMAADPELLEQTAAIMAKPAQPVHVPRPARPRLPVRPEDGSDGTGFFATLSDDEPLPFVGNKEELALAPALSAPLPPAPKEDDVDATAAVGVVFAGLALPFAAGGEEQEPAPDLEPAEDSRQHVEIDTPSSLHHVDEQGTMPEDVSGPSYAFPIVAEDSVDETALGVAIVTDPLPFQEGAAPKLSPAPRVDEPAQQAGETGFVDAAMLGLAVTPFADAPRQHEEASVDETTFGVTLSDDPVLPFVHGPAALPPRTDVPTHEQAGETGFVDLSKLDLNAGAPFLAPRRDPEAVAAQAAPSADLPLAQRPLLASASPGAARLTLSQYAAVETEIALDASTADRVLNAYGIDSSGRRAHAEALRTLMRDDPAAREVWEQAKAAYRAWRQSG